MKRYIIESALPHSQTRPSLEWRKVPDAEFEDLDDAEREWWRLDDLCGHNTYHRIVDVNRRVAVWP